MHAHESQAPGFQPQGGVTQANPLAPRPFEVTFPGQEVAAAPTNPFVQRSANSWATPPAAPPPPAAPTPPPEGETDVQDVQLDWRPQFNLFAEGQSPPDPPRSPWGIQAKLTIGRPNDAYEQEADRVAAQVMTMPAPIQRLQRQQALGAEAAEEIQPKRLAETITPLVQRQELPEDDTPVQAKCDACEPEEVVQRSPKGVPQVQTNLEERLNASKGGGSPLSEDVRSFMEPRFGADFSQVRVHTGGDAVQMSQEVGAQAFAHGQDIYFNSGYYNPDSNRGKELLAHELTHTIQQTGGVQRRNKQVQRQFEEQAEPEALQAKAIAHTIRPFQRHPIQRQATQEEDGLQAKAIATPTAPVINRQSPPEMAAAESEVQAKTLNPQESTWIHQDATLEGKPVQAKSLAITPSSPHLQGNWLTDGWNAVRSGAQSVAQGVAGAVSSGVDAIRQRLLQPVAQLASRMPGYPLLTVILGRDPVTGAAVERNATNLVRGILSFVPGGDQMFQNLQESRALENAFNWLSEQVTRLNLTWDAIRGLFQRAWESLTSSDLLDPSAAFDRIRNIFADPIQRIRNFASAVGQKILEFIFEGAIRLAGGASDQVMGIIRRAGGVFTSIIQNPIGFVGNLVQAVRGGFQRFAGNILTHLRSGLMGWLFGALAGAGLQMPQSFDLRGIVSIVLQIIGATYQRLRGMLARRIGEQRVARLEQIFSFLQTLVTEGLAGAWRQIMEFAGNLQEMVIGGIREWVMNSIVQAAVTRLLTMFNPAGAIVQAAIAIYNTVMFFVERAQQIATLANAVFESIANIASGNLGGAIAYVEQAMARSLPVIISFMARLLGLGNVAGQIRNIIGRVQGAVERAIERLVGWITTRASSLLGRGRGTGTTAGAQRQDPERERRVQAGLAAIDQKEQQYLQGGKISRQDAERVASETRREHSVFNSITVVDGGRNWNYDYVARAIKQGEEKKESGTDDPKIEEVREQIREKLRSPLLKPGPYARESIAASDPYSVPAANQREINRIGNLYGCHHTNASTPGQAQWTGDHQPVTQLVERANQNPELLKLVQEVGLPTSLSGQRLYPHCFTAYKSQGGTVTAIINKLGKLERLKRGGE